MKRTDKHLNFFIVTISNRKSNHAFSFNCLLSKAGSEATIASIKKLAAVRKLSKSFNECSSARTLPACTQMKL